MKHFKTLSIKNKFFFSMLFSSILVILILMVTTNAVFYQNFVKNETIASGKQLDATAKQLRFFLSSVTNYSKTIISASTIQESCYEYKHSDHLSADRLTVQVRSELEHIIQSTNYIHSVTLYSIEKKPLLSTATYPISLPIETLSDNPQGNWLPSEKVSNTNSSSRINTLSFVRPFYSYLTGEFLGYLEISILESSISEIYQNQFPDKNFIFITDQNGIIQSTNDYFAIGENFSGFDVVEKQVDFSSDFSRKNVVFSKYFPELNWYIINLVKTTDFMQSIYVTVLLCIGIGLICILIYTLLAHKLSTTITSPLHALIQHTQTIKEGAWTQLPSAPKDKDVGSLFSAFNSMISAQETLKNELLEEQKAKNKLSLDLLQEQINPHFLYNTLDNICSLAELGENETLIDIVMNLSTFYREGLSNGQLHITIKEELEITRAYLQIMQIRYLDKFDFTIVCDDSLLNYSCIKLLLQPIVENSIYHGIKEINHKGFLNVHVTEEKDGILFTITDNGIGFPPEVLPQIWSAHANHFGIKNIHQRVQLYYGINYGLTIKNHPSGGCITKILIEKRYAN